MNIIDDISLVPVEINVINKSLKLDAQLIPCWVKKNQINKTKIEKIVSKNYQKKAIFTYGITINDVETMVSVAEKTYESNNSMATKNSLIRMKEVLFFLKNYVSEQKKSESNLQPLLKGI